MKTFIQQYFSEKSTIRHRTHDIEAYVEQQMGDEYEASGGYDGFYAAMQELVADGEIKPVRSWKLNKSLSPSLYYGYQWVPKKELNTDFVRNTLTQYHTKMDMTFYLNHPDVFMYDQLFLQQNIF